MAEEFYSFDEVLHILQIDEGELKRLISQGELRGIREGDQVKFRKSDVDRLRAMRESEPTIILTDSDAELAVPSEEQLVIEDTHERETVAGVEIFETEELPTLLKEEETAVGAPAPGEETVVDMRRVAPAAPTPPVEETVAAAPIEEYEVVAPTRAESGRISRSARLRAMQIKRRAPHTVWTFLLLASLVILLLNLPFVMNTLRNTAPLYAKNLANDLRSLGELIMSLFASK